MRWFGVLLALGLVTSTADAQVFKPKTKSSAKAPAKASGSDAPKKSAAKKSARTSPSKKRVGKSKKSAKHSDDQASESAPKESDKDFVQITDDDDIE